MYFHKIDNPRNFRFPSLDGGFYQIEKAGSESVDISGCSVLNSVKICPFTDTHLRRKSLLFGAVDLQL